MEFEQVMKEIKESQARQDRNLKIAALNLFIATIFIIGKLVLDLVNLIHAGV